MTIQIDPANRIARATAYNDAGDLAMRVRAIGIKPAADLTAEEEDLYTRYRDLGLVQGDARSILPTVAHWLHTLAVDELTTSRACSCSWARLPDPPHAPYVVAWDVDCAVHGWTEPKP